MYINDPRLIVSKFRSDILRDMRYVILVRWCDKKFVAGPVIATAVEEAVDDAAQIHPRRASGVVIQSEHADEHEGVRVAPVLCLSELE